MATQDKMVNLAIKIFQHNLALARQIVASGSAEMAGHEHGLFCFSWRRCRKVEKEVRLAQGHTEEYPLAIAGLETGDYSKAIEIIGELISEIIRNDKSWDRLALMMNGITPPAGALVWEMNRLKEHLESLQKGGL